MAELLTAALVGLAGIAGTLLGVTLTERMRREGTRREHLLTHRLTAYAELLPVAARLVDNTRDWAFAPLEELEQDDRKELDRLVGRIRVVASEEVRNAFLELNTRVQEFHLLREMEVVPHHHRLRRDGQAEDELSRRQRMALSDKAEGIAESYERIEAAIRADVGPNER